MNATELDSIVAKYDLNEHPFYQAWRAGTLPRTSLSAYATDYAPFIEAVEHGWRTLGNDDHADAERTHARLWARFRDAFTVEGEAQADSTPCESPSCKEAVMLHEIARHLFDDRASAIGALYAFEAQQPSTARSKLAGLREHYTLTDDASAYFREHADDYGERDELRGHIAELDAHEYAHARAACEAMCVAMWGTLDGILAATAPELAHCS